jgi:DNA polymerase III subunit delta
MSNLGSSSQSVEKFLGRLSKGKPVAGVLLLGGELYLRDLCRAKLVEAYVPEGGRDWGVTRFSAAEHSLDRVISRAQTMPMLTPVQVVFLEEVEALEKIGENARERAIEALASYLDDPAPFTVMVLEAVALDERTRLFKTLSAKTLVVLVELGDTPEERQIAAARMAMEMAKEQRVELSADAAEELVEAVNGDLTRLRSELEKLGAYAGDRHTVSRTDVETLVVSAKKYTVWELADMLAAQQGSRALEFLHSLLREGEQPAGLVGAMSWMFRKLIEAQELPRQVSGWQAARQLGMRAATAELAVQQSRKIPRARLLDGLAALYEADSRLKSGPADPRAVLEFLVARLAGTASCSHT